MLGSFRAKAVAYPQTVSRGVGQVANQVVTSREVVIVNFIEQALLNNGNKKNIDKSVWMIQLDSPDFQKQLSQWMIQILVKLEAETFSVAQVSAEELKAEINLVKESLKDWHQWKALDVTDVEIEQILLIRKSAKNFLKFKTESAGVVISDIEAKNYYEKNKVKFGGAPFAQFKDGIKEVLSQQQLEEKLKDWFEILKRKYRVRFLKNDFTADNSFTCLLIYSSALSAVTASILLTPAAIPASEVILKNPI